MEPKFLLSTWLLTRKCNLRCSYCTVWKTKLSELTEKEKQEALLILKQLNQGINVLLGGEPLVLGDEMVRLVSFMEHNNVSYALITNSVLWKDYRYKLLKAGLSNWSPSIDTINFEYDKDIYQKSKHGYESALWFKAHGVRDVVAQITATRQNLNQIPAIIEEMNKHGIWSEIMPLHYAKDENYDYCTPRHLMEDLVFKPEDIPKIQTVAEKVKSMANKGYLVHHPPEFFEGWVKHQINLNWKCTKPLIVNLDADGSLRLCVYNKGKRVRKWSIFDLANPQLFEEYIQDWYRDNKECKGCFWDCSYLIETLSSKIGAEKTSRWVKHL